MVARYYNYRDNYCCIFEIYRTIAAFCAILTDYPNVYFTVLQSETLLTVVVTVLCCIGTMLPMFDSIGCIRKYIPYHFTSPLLPFSFYHRDVSVSYRQSATR